MRHAQFTHEIQCHAKYTCTSVEGVHWTYIPISHLHNWTLITIYQLVVLDNLGTSYPHGVRLILVLLTPKG